LFAVVFQFPSILRVEALEKLLGGRVRRALIICEFGERTVDLAQGEDASHWPFGVESVDQFAIVTAGIVGRVGANDFGPLNLTKDAMLLSEHGSEHDLGNSQCFQLRDNIHLVVVALLSLLVQSPLLVLTQRILFRARTTKGQPGVQGLH